MIVVAGAGLIGNREDAADVLWLALAVSAGALLVRRRAPLVVLGVVLELMVALDAEAVTILPALLALLTAQDDMAPAGTPDTAHSQPMPARARGRPP